MDKLFGEVFGDGITISVIRERFVTALRSASQHLMLTSQIPGLKPIWKGTAGVRILVLDFDMDFYPFRLCVEEVDDFCREREIRALVVQRYLAEEDEPIFNIHADGAWLAKLLEDKAVHGSIMGVVGAISLNRSPFFKEGVVCASPFFSEEDARGFLWNLFRGWVEEKASGAC